MLSLARTSRSLLSKRNLRLLRSLHSASEPKRLHKFILWAPDVKDSARLTVQRQHRADIAPHIKSGTVKVGGQMVNPESIEFEDAPVKPFGSCIIYEAESMDVVRSMVESDIYYTSGVWDKEKLVLLPLQTVTSFP